MGNYKNCLKIDQILNAKMLDKNLTNRDLAETIGVSNTKIKDIKNALRRVNAMLFCEICKALEIKMEEVFLERKK
jgi:DNA-binding Xre family transcriptional regulator